MNLAAILTAYGISQPQLAAGVMKSDGKPYSTAAINRIVRHGEYPKSADRDAIRAQIQDRLAALGVTETVAWPTEKTNTWEYPEMQALTQQARQAFGLFRSPFVDDVQTREDVYLSDEQRYIRQNMLFAAKQSGFIAIIGESGAGKTTLKRDLIEGIKQENESVIIIQPQSIDKTRLTVAHLCDAIIEDVSQGTATPRRTMEAKARQIQRLLTDSSRAGNKHCLIIDEAHDLTIAMLKYLKRFWELEDGMRRLLGIVLIGQPELKLKLSERNADLREVVRRCEQIELQPLNAYVEDYLKHKFKRAGKDYGEIFAADAASGLTQRLTRQNGKQTVSMLYPLVVNNTVICALNEAAKLGYRQVTADIFNAI
ncbi:ExeA family protein [Cardiobacterium valvarum]|uniref:Predicted ATPase (AAA+ superfamily) n=1 Tax=Cardiobacterium valvarum TaxID=194702 RepID=A0A381E3Z0_9GAMM|nr:AAA family ATPase [Cardiobacterium valvarum]SUX20829.1 Predicted ATPase (AAA+ superfamily) [Cardiobacterium valvarum]